MFVKELFLYFYTKYFKKVVHENGHVLSVFIFYF